MVIFKDQLNFEMIKWKNSTESTKTLTPDGVKFLNVSIDSQLSIPNNLAANQPPHNFPNRPPSGHSKLRRHRQLIRGVNQGIPKQNRRFEFVDRPGSPGNRSCIPRTSEQCTDIAKRPSHVPTSIYTHCGPKNTPHASLREIVLGRIPV